MTRDERQAVKEILADFAIRIGGMYQRMENNPRTLNKEVTQYAKRIAAIKKPTLPAK